ncbi:MAG: UPF0175 family protein [Leptospiraceae bacterium]|nr:UPF0175 family protein [Leptospiraceae bacterium]MCP5502801.1 UPF0175 family protein [Leptospiraceae bacterium]
MEPKRILYSNLPDSITIPEEFRNIKAEIIIWPLEEVSNSIELGNQEGGEELKIEFAVFLYDKKKYTLETCSKIAGIDILSFQKELGKRKVLMHYSVEDFEDDVKTLKELKRI